MSVKGFPAFLNKFKYEDRSSFKAKLENGSSSGASSSSQTGHRDDTSDTDIDDKSEISCIPETPTSLVCSPSSPVSKTRRLTKQRYPQHVKDLCSSDSEDCQTPQTSKAQRGIPKAKPTIRSLSERKFRLISTGSESSDSETGDVSSVMSIESRSSSPVFGASRKEKQNHTGATTIQPSSNDTSSKKLYFASSTGQRSPLQFTALPSSSSESDTDATTLDSHHKHASMNPAGLSDLETPPPTVTRKKKRRRILSEGQDSVEEVNKDDEDTADRQQDAVIKLQEMFPTWTYTRLQEVLKSADWCLDEAASVIASKMSEDEHSDDVEPFDRKKMQSRKRLRIENTSDKENWKKELDSSKMTAYFPKITNPSKQMNDCQKKPEDGTKANSDDEGSVNSISSDEAVQSDTYVEEDAQEAKMNQLILDFFNDATPEQLLTISQCSKTKAKKIESLRPYEDYSDLVDKFESTKGLSSTLIWNCNEVFHSQQVITTLMDNCTKISNKIQTIVSAMDQDELDTKKKIEDGQIIQQPALLSDTLVLKPYQLIGLNWLALMHKQGVNGILADEMGLGKTVQTIAFLTHLFESGDEGPHLIVVPSSTLENWVREFHTWCPSLDVLLYTGSVGERMELGESILARHCSCNIIISSYNMCISNAADRSLFRKMDIHYAVFDEAHMLKNMQSQRYRLLMKIKASRKLLLTGTPLQNNLKELISLLSFVMPSMFCDSAAELQKIFCLSKQKSDNPMEQSAFERERITHAKQILQPFILRRVKSQVLKQLPKKVENIERCPMVASQELCYNNIKTTLSRDLRNLDGGSKMNNLSCALMQLRKAANHEMLMRTHYDDSKLRQMAKLMLKEPTHYDADPDLIFEDMSVMSDFELHELCNGYYNLKSFKLSPDVILASGKFRILDQMLPELKQTGSRVLMFSQFVMVLDIIEFYMKHHKYHYLRLDGQTQVCNRLALIDKYNNDENIFVFLLSTRAGGLGINLTSANHVILHDIDYNPYNDKQAEDRCHRVGQKRDVTITKLVSSNTIEEGMLKCAQYKLQLEEQMTSTDGADGDSRDTADIAALLKDALV